MSDRPKTASVGIDIGDNKVVRFKVVTGNSRPAYFALGVRKSGSSIFCNIVEALSDYNNINVVDIPSKLFERNYRLFNTNENFRDAIWGGNTYIGFRNAPTNLYGDPVFKKAKKIILVRDPRDALVSEYFSNAYSHSLPKENPEGSVIYEERQKALDAGLEEYVRKRAVFIDRTVARYLPLLEEKNSLLLRYEDVILEKRTWMEQICTHFEWDSSSEYFDQIIGWADIVPVSENKKAFVRRVVPGDFRNKLSDEAIGQVVSQLSPYWADLGYVW